MIASGAVPPFDPDAPLPCAPGGSPFHMKGMAYRGFVRHVDKQVPGGLAAFRAAVPDPRLGDFLAQPFLATGRYDVLPCVPLFATLARIARRPFEDLVSDSAAAQSRFDVKTVFKMMFASGGVEVVASCFTRFNAQYYDFGKFRGTVGDAKRLTFEHLAVPAYLFPWIAPMHTGYAAETARLLGASDVRARVVSVEAAGKRGAFPLVNFWSELTWR